MELTKAMKERAKTLGAEWRDEGDGYGSLSGVHSRMSHQIAYISLPDGHPFMEFDFNDPDSEVANSLVHGGITYTTGNVIGWDYAHAGDEDKVFDTRKDIDNALKLARLETGGRATKIREIIKLARELIDYAKGNPADAELAARARTLLKKATEAKKVLGVEGE
jgi:hypothetical protein